MPPARRTKKTAAAPKQEAAAKVAPPAASAPPKKTAPPAKKTAPAKPPVPEPAEEQITVQTMRLWTGGPDVGSVDTVTRTEFLDGLIRRGYVRVVDGP